MSKCSAPSKGEGKYLGVPSYFIRTTGCNLRCSWKNLDGTLTICDTPYTSFNPERGYNLDVQEVLRLLKSTKTKHVVITGGEPSLQRDLADICNIFTNKAFTVTVETNGTIYHENMEKSFISLSPKLKNSYSQENSQEKNIHEKHNHFEESCLQWMQSNDYQYKFVVNNRDDIIEISELIQLLNIPINKVYLMPQGISREQFKQKEKWLFRECERLGVNYTPRLHIDIWGNVRGI